MTITTFEVLPSLPTRDELLSDPILREAADRAYYASRTGPWTILPCAVAYCPLSHILQPEELLQLRSSAETVARQTGRQHDAILARQFEASSDPRGQMEFYFDLGNWSPLFVSEPGKKYATLMQMLQYPFSRGSTHIPSRREKGSGGRVTIDDKPFIDPRYYQGLEGEIDRKIMAATQRFADRIGRTEPMAQIIKRRVCPPEATDMYDEFVKDHTLTEWHRKYPPFSLRLLADKLTGDYSNRHLRDGRPKGLRSRCCRRAAAGVRSARATCYRC